MSDETDPEFFKRADAFIGLANAQVEQATRGKTSASLMYATARFNAWISAHGFDTAAEMATAKPEIIDYFLTEYRTMLEENLDDYITNFDAYMKPAN